MRLGEGAEENSPPVDFRRKWEEKQEGLTSTAGKEISAKASESKNGEDLKGNIPREEWGGKGKSPCGANWKKTSNRQKSPRELIFSTSRGRRARRGR